VTTVLLVRHGSTSANAAGVLAGWTPGLHLNEKGRQDAKILAQRLSGLPIAGVVTSPMERCRETAEILSSGLSGNLRLNSDLDLAECRYGDWTGRTLSELRAEPLWEAVVHTPSAVTFPNGESLSGVQARALHAIRRWNKTYAGGVYLAISHGDVIKAVLADALGMHLDMFQRIVVEPCSVSVVRYAAGRPLVLRVNDVGGDLAGAAGGSEPGPVDIGGGDRL